MATVAGPGEGGGGLGVGCECGKPVVLFRLQGAGYTLWVCAWRTTAQGVCVPCVLFLLVRSQPYVRTRHIRVAGGGDVCALVSSCPTPSPPAGPAGRLSYGQGAQGRPLNPNPKVPQGRAAAALGSVSARGEQMVGGGGRQGFST